MGLTTSDIIFAVYLYMVIYNLTLLLIFNILLNTIINTFQTMNSLGSFHSDAINVFFLIIAFASMGGVPPLFGFFTKLLIFIHIGHSAMFFLFFLLTIVFLVSLYFYFQNIRFLYANFISNTNPFFLETSFHLIPIYFNYIIVFFLIMGGIFYDDFFLLFS